MYEMPYTVQKLLFLLLTYDGVLKVFCKVSAANSYTHCNVSELKTMQHRDMVTDCYYC